MVVQYLREAQLVTTTTKSATSIQAVEIFIRFTNIEEAVGVFTDCPR
jgi:hypothetical protein